MSVSHKIEVDDDVFQLLRQAAEPFVDTPNTVLRRLLGLSSQSSESQASQTRRQKKRGRRTRRARGAASKPSSGSPGTRATTGTLLSEEEYVRPILTVLRRNGGRAPAREVTEAVGEILADRLTEMDRKNISSGAIRWHSRVQFARLRMVDRALLKKNSPRGVWEITDAGIEFLDKNLEAKLR